MFILLSTEFFFVKVLWRTFSFFKRLMMPCGYIKMRSNAIVKTEYFLSC